MSHLQPAVGQRVFLQRAGLGELIAALRAEGYTVIGPVVHAGVIVLRPVESAEQLASGLRDVQDRGHYRLEAGNPELYFEHVVGADSPKRHVFPPVTPLFHMHMGDGRFAFDIGPPQPPKIALVGIRPCELAALEIMDRIFTTGNRCESDAYYIRTRKNMFTVAVNCTRPGGNCFCASMDTGPAARGGFDIAMTELRGGFVLQVGSAKGAQLAGKLDVREPSSAELELAELRLERAREKMGRSLETDGIVELLNSTLEHPRWDEVAKRCLGCGNCTMVCPTCFCSSIDDGSDLTGGVSRTRVWDSCHTHQFTYTTAGPVRHSIRARYRHWLRHKLCTFHEQFDASGCVGCGRCITWCPAGIDITEEAAAIRATAVAPQEVKSSTEVIP